MHRFMKSLGPAFNTSVLGPLQALTVDTADAEQLRKIGELRTELETVAEEAVRRADELAEIEGPLKAAFDLDPHG